MAKQSVRKKDATASKTGNPFTSLFTTLAEIEENLGLYDSAIGMYSAALGQNPRAAHVLSRRALLFLFKGDDAKAHKDIQAAVSANPSDAQTLRVRGIVSLCNGQFEKAASDLRAAQDSGLWDGPTALLLAAASVAAEKTEDLPERMQKSLDAIGDPDKWPAPLINYCLGSLSYENLTTYAGSGVSNKMTELRFYLGLLKINAKNIRESKSELEWSLENGHKNLIIAVVAPRLLNWLNTRDQDRLLERERRADEQSNLSWYD